MSFSPIITKQIFIVFLLALSFFLSLTSYTMAQAEEEEAVACTMDAMMCPDGSYVGRTGPNCQFVCPTSTEVATTTESEEANSSTTVDTPANNLRESIMENREAIRSERQSALEGVRQQRVINLAANISNRMDGVVARLFNIIGRLEQRIIKMEQSGLVTDPAEEKVQASARGLAEARSLLKDIDTLVYGATTSATPASDWRTVRDRYQTIGQLIRQAHLDLRAAISLLKSAPLVGQEPEVVTEEASTTPTLAQ